MVVYTIGDGIRCGAATLTPTFTSESFRNSVSADQAHRRIPQRIQVETFYSFPRVHNSSTLSEVYCRAGHGSDRMTAVFLGSPDKGEVECS
jgi:hypothetical protein